MENTKISWAHHTVNLWHGCYEVNKACDNCYAKAMSNRFHSGENSLWEQQGPRMYIKSAMNDLLKYQARAAKEGVVYRIFINSMSDLFEKSMPVVDHEHKPMMFNKWFDNKGDALLEDEQLETGHIRQRFFYLIGKCPNLFFILLTKRPSNIVKYVPQYFLDSPPANVIYMTSCPDQESIDTLVPQLLKVPGKHGLSLEPLIDEINLHPYICKYGDANKPEQHYANICEPSGNLHWVIVGGESGHKARSMLLNWAFDIQKQCEAAGVPYFLKQDSELHNKDYKNIDTFPERMRVRQFPEYEFRALDKQTK